MDELIGFVSSNDKRDRILGILGHHGTLDREFIAKRARMIPLTTGKILEELQEKGLVEEKDGYFSLTETGTEVEKRMKGLR